MVKSKANRMQITIKTADTKRKIAMIKAERLFKSFNETIDYLIFVYENIPDDMRERLNEMWEEKKEKKNTKERR